MKGCSEPGLIEQAYHHPGIDRHTVDLWYDQLNATVSVVPQHDMLLIIGDFNAKVGRDNNNGERVMGKYGCGTMSENDERIANLCEEHNLVVGGTIFPHKQIHKLTPRSPNSGDVNQIDHIFIKNKWRSLLDVRV